MPIFCQLNLELWQEIWKWLKGHFWSVAKAELRTWCETWNSNLEIYLIHISTTVSHSLLELTTLMDYKNNNMETFFGAHMNYPPSSPPSPFILHIYPEPPECKKMWGQAYVVGITCPFCKFFTYVAKTLANLST